MQLFMDWHGWWMLAFNCSEILAYYGNVVFGFDTIAHPFLRRECRAHDVFYVV